MENNIVMSSLTTLFEDEILNLTFKIGESLMVKLKDGSIAKISVKNIV